MLYLLNKQAAKTGLELARLDPNPILVLIEDGCYLNPHTIKDNVKIYAIKQHMAERGLLEKNYKMELITFEDLVELIESAPVANFG